MASILIFITLLAVLGNSFAHVEKISSDKHRISSTDKLMKALAKTSTLFKSPSSDAEKLQFASSLHTATTDEKAWISLASGFSDDTCSGSADGYLTVQANTCLVATDNGVTGSVIYYVDEGMIYKTVYPSTDCSGAGSKLGVAPLGCNDNDGSFALVSITAGRPPAPPVGGQLFTGYANALPCINDPMNPIIYFLDPFIVPNKNNCIVNEDEDGNLVSNTISVIGRAIVYEYYSQSTTCDGVSDFTDVRPTDGMCGNINELGWTDAYVSTGIFTPPSTKVKAKKAAAPKTVQRL